MLYKSKIKKKNYKGFTMIEILLVMGFIAIASTSTYLLYDQVKASYVADAEIKNLGTLMERVDKSYDSVSSYSSISLNNVRNLNIPIENKLDLVAINSPNPSSVQYDYTNVTSAICTKFAKSLVYKGENISAIINGQPIPSFAEIPTITGLCNQSLNSVTIVKNNPGYNGNPNLALTNPTVYVNPNNPIPVVTSPPATGVWGTPVKSSDIDKSVITTAKNNAQSLTVNKFGFITKTGITNVGTGTPGTNISCSNCDGTNATPGGNPPVNPPGTIPKPPSPKPPPNPGVTDDPELVENYSCHTYAYDQARTASAYTNHSIGRDILFLEQYDVFNYQVVSSRQVYEQTGTVPRWIPPTNPPPPAKSTPGYYVYDPVFGWVTYNTYDWVAGSNAYPSCNYQDSNCRPLDYDPGYSRQEYKGNSGPSGRKYKERVLRRETDTNFSFDINPDPAQSQTAVDQGQTTIIEGSWTSAGIAPVPVAAWCTQDLYNLVKDQPYNPLYQQDVLDNIRTGPSLSSNRGWAPSYQASQLVQTWFGPGGSGYDLINTKSGFTNGGNTAQCKSNALCNKSMGSISTTGNFTKDGLITFTFRTVFNR